MGISGAPVAMTIAYSTATGIMLWILFTGRSRLRLTLRNFRLDLNIIWRIVRIGFPALVSMMQQNLLQLIMVRLVAPFGTTCVAAHGIVQRVQMIIIMPAMALGMGSGVLVGQNLGAGQPRRAERSAWLTVGVVEAIVVTCSLAILLWPGAIVRIFNSEPGLVATASSFLRIAVAGYVVVGFMAVFMMSLNGAGDTMPTMIFSVAMVWLVALPLAYYLPKITDLGVYGVRWGMASGMVFAGIIYPIYFMLGRWKRKKV
jgi:putative MATE family efflux protein